MASSDRENKQLETVNSESYDPELDFFSEHFNPLKALSIPGLVPPVPDAYTHDNLAMYESKSKRKETGDKCDKKILKETKGETFERKWLPHQRKLNIWGYVFCLYFPFVTRWNLQCTHRWHYKKVYIVFL